MPPDVKMMPGQTPYTDEELEQLYLFVGHAAEAEEYFSDEELEEYARKHQKKEPT